jgi:hypothetical protein
MSLTAGNELAIAPADARRPVLQPDRSALIREIIGVSVDEPREPTEEANEKADRSPRSCSAELLFNADCDCRYAVVDPRFNDVVHVFHQEWHGIRSAAGALPGNKVAAPLAPKLRGRDREQLVSRLAAWGARRAVFHGFSPSAEAALKTLCAEGIACYLVWHGNLAQFAWRPEVDYFRSALRAAARGLFRRTHMLKAGMGIVFPNAFEPMLLNSVPVINRARAFSPFASPEATALVPGFVDIRKNVHTSLVGCAMSSIESVLHYGKILGNLTVLKRCQRIPYGGHDRHLSLLAQIDVTVNASVIDCHPMVEVEALAAGSMSLTGPLYLDALQEHPYTKLSAIQNPFAVKDIASRLDYLRTMDAAELDAIIADYRNALQETSLNRYVEFLGI